MKDQVARDKIREERHSRMADSFLLGRRVSVLEKNGLTYRRCPKCKRNTLQICYVDWILGGIQYDEFFRCTLCDSAIFCHNETKCEIIGEKK